MDIEKLIEQLNDWNEKYISNLCGERTIKCEEYCIKDDCLIVKAATVLSTLQAENEKLRGEMESVRAERNAAVEDVAAIIGDVEEIRRGYGVDNADADGAFAELCETYCANNGRLCYAECEKYRCKNFKWRGQKED